MSQLHEHTKLNVRSRTHQAEQVGRAVQTQADHHPKQPPWRAAKLRCLGVVQTPSAALLPLLHQAEHVKSNMPS